MRGRPRLGVEIKRTTAPAVTKSMHVALKDLRLSRLLVIHAGRETFDLAPRIRAVASTRLLTDLNRL